uniref:Secreted protein n=1 Tax=Phakopsora pachyrhizi TaxID=170000 RepID=A0A0S1MID4_PHAPC
MNQSLFYPLFALVFASAALATIHTQCYSYFRNKDNCVNSAADDRVRCSSMKEVPAGISQVLF